MLKNTKNCNCKSMDILSLIIGSVAGGILGGTAAFLMAPKKASSCWDKFCGSCSHIIDKAEELEEDLVDKGKCAYCNATDFAEHMKDKTAHLIKSVQGSSVPLIIGAVGAGILAYSASMMLGNERSRSKSGVDWITLAAQMKESISSMLAEGKEEIEERPIESHTAKNVMDWALLGLHLWDNIKKRR